MLEATQMMEAKPEHSLPSPEVRGSLLAATVIDRYGHFANRSHPNSPHSAMVPISRRKR